jgi:LmbE family N-acetylglucosaminyl deacetylase
MVLAAHPDDDVLGAGALLARAPDAHVVYVTDGAPRDGEDARAHGFCAPAAYAAARRREAEAALALASVGAEQIVRLEIADQGATFALDRIVGALRDLVAAIRPSVILTHAYEGGHPDHDATAFAARAALADACPGAPLLAEFSGYHAGSDGRRETSFLADDRAPETRVVLSPVERRLKAAMFACHATQAAVLAGFPGDRETFRRAPAYDFSRPPHAGPLYYEARESGAAWGIDGACWRSEAAAAGRRLGLP